MKNIDFFIIYKVHLRHEQWRYCVFLFIIALICIGIGLLFQRHFNFLIKKDYIQKNRLITMMSQDFSIKKRTKKSPRKSLEKQIFILKKITGALSKNTHLDQLLFKSHRLLLRGRSVSFTKVKAFALSLQEGARISPFNTFRYNNDGKFMLIAIFPY